MSTKSMQALVWEGSRRMTVRRVPLPQPMSGEARVRVDAVGICGSELAGYLGHNRLRTPPLVMGHEFAGTVDAPAPEAESLPEGTRVTVNPLVSCGTCPHCSRGRANLCAERALIGAHRAGAFAEYVIVPSAACMPIPDDMEGPLAAMAEPAACAVRAGTLSEAGPGSAVLVIGAGPIGILCAHLAQRHGAEVAITDTNPARREMARAWGITRVLDAVDGMQDGDAGAVFEGRDPDAVIDAVGRDATRRQAVEGVRRGGTVVFVGLHEAEVSFDGNDVVRNEIAVRGSFAYTPSDFETAVQLLTRGALPEPGPWMSVRPLEEGPASFDELVDTSPDVLKIVLRP